MKESVYKSYEELPLFLNAKMVGRRLALLHPAPMSSCTNQIFLF